MAAGGVFTWDESWLSGLFGSSIIIDNQTRRYSINTVCVTKLEMSQNRIILAITVTFLFFFSFFSIFKNKVFFFLIPFFSSS
jgi:hypothetical protein